LLFVASERGLARPWVWFECETFWFSGRKIVPLCFGAVRKNALSPPLSELQAVNGDDPSDLKTALDCAAEASGAILTYDSNLDSLSEELKKLDGELAVVSRTSSGWLGADWKGRFLAYEGPYETLPLIEDAIYESSMQAALATAGYRISLYDEANFRNIGDSGRFIYLTDRRTFRRRIAQGAAWVVARPA
jgi:hypothetical protein